MVKKIDILDAGLGMISIILDKLYEKYPEYFEGEGMGFFDLKQK